MQRMMVASYPVFHGRTASASSLRAIRSTHAILCLCLAVAGLVAAFGIIDADEILDGAALLFALLAFWTLWSWYKLHATIFDPYGLFLLSSWMFNGGQVFLEVARLNSHGLLDGIFSSTTLLRTEFLVALAIFALHMGALWTCGAAGGPADRQCPNAAAGSDLSWHTRWVGWFLFAISIGPALWAFRESVRTVLNGGDMSLYQVRLATGLATAPQLIANFLVPSAMFLLAGSKGRRTGVALSAAIIFSYVAGTFFLGGRAAASTALIGYLWLYSRTVRRIRVRTLVLPGLAIAFVVFPLVRAVREVRGLDRTSLEFTRSAWSSVDNPVVMIVSEVGNSMGTVAYTLDLVPTIRPYDGGVSYVYALLAVVPNLFWDVHPTTAHGTMSVWLVKTVQPGTAAVGGGLGYSYIAEAYANFGFTMGPLAIMILGAIAGKLSSSVLRAPNQAVLAMAATGISYAMIYARAETGDFMRGVVWYALAPYLLVRFLSGVRR